MSREEYLEFITHQPYDAMGDFSFLLDEKSDKAENTALSIICIDPFKSTPAAVKFIECRIFLINM